MVPTVSPSPAVIVATDGAVLMVSLSPTWAMVRWTRTILSGNDRCHAVALAGTQPGPPSGAPRPGAPPGRPRGKFPGPGPPGPGAARGAPGGPKWPPAGAPKWALFGPSSYIKYNRKWGVQGGTPLGVLLGPGGPGGPGGPKSAHFFGYLITLPVGTVLGTFFGPPGTGQNGGIRGQIGGYAVWVRLYGTISHTMRSMSQLGPVRLGSMAATGPARASSARVGGT